MAHCPVAGGARPQAPYVLVEHCIGCAQHAWCTKHDEGKYAAYASEVSRIVEGEGLPVVINAAQPRVGAFEVTLVTEDGQSEILHSKRNSLRWPHTESLLEHLKYILHPETAPKPRRPRRPESRGEREPTSPPASAMNGGLGYHSSLQGVPSPPNRHAQPKQSATSPPRRTGKARSPRKERNSPPPDQRRPGESARSQQERLERQELDQKQANERRESSIKELAEMQRLAEFACRAASGEEAVVDGAARQGLALALQAWAADPGDVASSSAERRAALCRAADLRHVAVTGGLDVTDRLQKMREDLMFRDWTGSTGMHWVNSVATIEAYADLCPSAVRVRNHAGDLPAHALARHLPPSERARLRDLVLRVDPAQLCALGWDHVPLSTLVGDPVLPWAKLERLFVADASAFGPGLERLSRELGVDARPRVQAAMSAHCFGQGAWQPDSDKLCSVWRCAERLWARGEAAEVAWLLTASKGPIRAQGREPVDPRQPYRQAFQLRVAKAEQGALKKFTEYLQRIEPEDLAWLQQTPAAGMAEKVHAHDSQFGYMHDSQSVGAAACATPDWVKSADILKGIEACGGWWPGTHKFLEMTHPSESTCRYFAAAVLDPMTVVHALWLQASRSGANAAPHGGAQAYVHVLRGHLERILGVPVGTQLHDGVCVWCRPTLTQEELLQRMRRLQQKGFSGGGRERTLACAVTDLNVAHAVFPTSQQLRQVYIELMKCSWARDKIQVVRTDNGFHPKSHRRGYQDLRVNVFIQGPSMLGNQENIPILLELRLHLGACFALKQPLQLARKCRRGDFDHEHLKHLWDLEPANSPTSSKQVVVEEHEKTSRPSSRQGTAPAATTTTARAPQDGDDHVAEDEIQHRKDRLRSVKLFALLGDPELTHLASVIEVVHVDPNTAIINVGEEGLDCFLVDEGECYACIKFKPEPGSRLPSEIGLEWKEVKQYEPGGFFGERALLHSEPRAATVMSRTAAKLYRITKEDFANVIAERDLKESLIRGVKMFEMMNDDQVAKLAGSLCRMEIGENQAIFKQGDMGEHFYILEEGECFATIKMGANDQEVKRYFAGDMFGEKALLETAPRGATITAAEHSIVHALSRTDFEAKVGPLNQLEAEAYLSDPRKLIADFYGPGDERGPAGVLKAKGLTVNPKNETKWFVVYRPCSRDSIAKMLGKFGVGKGLNVKGKSAKKNRQSGFVPFIQISDNDHKSEIEVSPYDARTVIYYKSAAHRDEAKAALNKILREAKILNTSLRGIADPEVKVLTSYEPDAFGLDIPEPLMREAYILRPDLSPMVGWETGRASEPAFMDMNLHGVRGSSVPNVVVYQNDANDAMNPHGLVIAYAEKFVKPVVSDFDTFTVGSKGMKYEPTPPEQVDLIKWSLGHTRDILEDPKASTSSWTSKWLGVLKKEAERGFHPNLPKFGFGDPTSYGLIQHVVDVTEPCGAVRHGAECFNFYFPQELDDEFLIVWEGLQEKNPSDPPWKLVGEPELREFLLERAKEGFTFPLNPVWPIRDKGWYKVLEALRDSEDETTLASLDSWFPPESEVLDTIDEIHHENPGGFKNAQLQKRCTGVNDFTALAGDCGGTEMADFALEHVRRQVQARWRRIRFAFRMTILKFADQEKALDKTDPGRHDRGESVLAGVQ